MRYQTVRLGRDYPGKITDFAEARNSFLNTAWTLFLDDDEEVTQGFLNFLTMLQPTQPYYWIRRVNLYRGEYVPGWNPDFKPALVSDKVRFIGKVHERVLPKRPHGIIDIPIIHNHNGQDGTYQNKWYQDLPAYRLWLAGKKVVEVARGR